MQANLNALLPQDEKERIRSDAERSQLKRPKDALSIPQGWLKGDWGNFSLNKQVCLYTNTACTKFPHINPCWSKFPFYDILFIMCTDIRAK